MFKYIRELFAIKRMNDILDLVEIEKAKRWNAEYKFVSDYIKYMTADQLPMLYKPRLAFSYDRDLRPFVRRLMEIYDSNEIVVRHVMDLLDSQIESDVAMHKCWYEERKKIS